jgi:hypothetical protein
MSQKNHYLPIFYQKRWATNGQVCVYSRPHKEARVLRKHPAGVGYETDLYTANGCHPVVASYLENHFFKTTDDLAAKALAIIEQGQWNPMDTLVRSGWTRFIMSLLHRTPEEIRAMLALISSYVELTREKFEARYDEIRTTSDPPNFEDYWNAQLSDFVGRVWIQANQRTIDSKKIGDHINSLIWQVIEIHGAYTFITCDRPIIMTNGMIAPGSHLALPIGPRKLFLATNTPNVIRSIEQRESDELATFVNNRIAQQARRFCIATDDTHLRFFAKRFGQRLPSSPFETILLSDDGASKLLQQLEAMFNSLPSHELAPA